MSSETLSHYSPADELESVPSPEATPAPVEHYPPQELKTREELFQEVDDLKRQLEESEQQRKALVRVNRETFRAVTEGKLEIVDNDAIPNNGELVIAGVAITGQSYSQLRKEVDTLATESGMDAERSGDLVLAMGEVIGNALKHGQNGVCDVYRTEDSIYVRVTDQGEGISDEDLPKALLQPGYSTKVSLGMGFTLALRLTDHMWLATDSEGTTVQLQKFIAEQKEPDELSHYLDKFQ